MVRRRQAELAASAHDGGDCRLAAPRRRNSAAEVRCDCGSLMARWTDAGIELKCRRCKRRVIIPVEGTPPRGPPA